MQRPASVYIYIYNQNVILRELKWMNYATYGGVAIKIWANFTQLADRLNKLVAVIIDAIICVKFHI